MNINEENQQIINHESVRKNTLINISNRVKKEVSKGKSLSEIIREENSKLIALGYHRSSIFKWLSRYYDKSKNKIIVNQKKRAGRVPTLNETAKKEISKLIKNNTPNQLQLDAALWTLPLVQKLISKELGFIVSKSSTSRLLKELALSPNNEEFRSRNIKDNKGAKVRNDARHVGSMFYGFKKKSVKQFKRGRFSLLSATSSKGKEYFFIFKGVFTEEQFIEFLKGLMHDVDSPIFLIIENHRIFKTRKVCDFIKSTGGNLCLKFLPSFIQK